MSVLKAVLAPLTRRAGVQMPVSSSEWTGGPRLRSDAGVTVTPATALNVSTVQACVTLIARSLASVPLVLYRGQRDGMRIPAVDHPAYNLMLHAANPVQTAFEVRQQLFLSALLYGNGYAEITWGPDGYPSALWPLSPEQVMVWVTGDRRLIYQVHGDTFGTDGQVRWLSDRQIHHVRGLAMNGLIGLSPLRAANAVGLAMATEEFGARFFGDGAHPSVVLSHPGKLSPEAVRNLRASFEAQWSGLSNSHRVAVVGEGTKAEPMRIAPNESQMLETRAFQVAEICRIFNVDPGLVGSQETQTYASAEQALIRFRELTLGPWARNHEERLLSDVLVEDERDDLFYEYKLSRLQMTDLKTRNEAHQIGILTGYITPNEVRALENLNPLPGGDALLRPLNMVTAGEEKDEPQDEEEPQSAQGEDDNDADEDGRAALLEQAGLAADLTNAWVADARRRLEGRIANDVRQAGAKALRQGGREGLSEWGETMIHEWRTAGDEMLAALRGVRPGAEPDVSAWVGAAYQACVKELIHE